jgi:DNA-binding NtrC family response regulator
VTSTKKKIAKILKRKKKFSLPELFRLFCEGKPDGIDLSPIYIDLNDKRCFDLGGDKNSIFPFYLNAIKAQKIADGYQVKNLVPFGRDDFSKLSLCIEFSELELGEGYEKEKLLGVSPVMIQLFEQVKRIAPMETHVLLLGETGTGKELIARALWKMSPSSSKGKFNAVNCAALPKSLLETELFGAKGGIATTVSKDIKGWFAKDPNGVLFLDEIGEIPASTQAKLLRVINDGEFNRLGDRKTEKFNGRLIFASNRPLFNQNERRKSGSYFRDDLYYRIAQNEITIPNLNQRILDIPILLYNFIKNDNSAFEIDFGEYFLLACLIKKWRGNIRELKNLIATAKAWYNLHVDEQCIRELELLFESYGESMPNNLRALVKRIISPKVELLNYDLLVDQLKKHKKNSKSNTDRTMDSVNEEFYEIVDNMGLGISIDIMYLWLFWRSKLASTNDSSSWGLTLNTKNIFGNDVFEVFRSFYRHSDRNYYKVSIDKLKKFVATEKQLREDENNHPLQKIDLYSLSEQMNLVLFKDVWQYLRSKINYEERIKYFRDFTTKSLEATPLESYGEEVTTELKSSPQLPDNKKEAYEMLKREYWKGIFQKYPNRTIKMIREVTGASEKTIRKYRILFGE